MILARLHLKIDGRVQGVGFRPFAFNLAQKMKVTGWVRNSTHGVRLEVEGSSQILQEFLWRLKKEKPTHAEIGSFDWFFLPRHGYEDFRILPSLQGPKTARVLPDLATCASCLQEILDPKNRRHAYPFTNCTQCGPRFTILKALPYDRAHTTMEAFAMCPPCRSEYEDPGNRRFHAQPNACTDCGPHLFLTDGKGKKLATKEKALSRSAHLLREGKILAVKGLGGFHLMVDGRSEGAVQRLRERKGRPDKPLALMFPDLNMIRDFAETSPLEEDLLQSSEAPIVLLKSRLHPRFPLAKNIAPANPYFGIMLPYTPLHHLLLRELNFPIVATSGNRSEEPICMDGEEARDRLKDIADFFLDHNRPIARAVDDSVVQVMAGRCTVLRRARGYGPTTFEASHPSASLLAVGAHLKNTVALKVGKEILLSPHIGDLDSRPAREAFADLIDRLQNFYEIKPKKFIRDLHPDYASTQFAEKNGETILPVQHHHAHVVSCMAEHDLWGPVLGIAWDGTGLGPDGTLWGGEFLRCTRSEFERVGHLRYFPLPGGEKAIREPRRAALGMLYEIFGDEIFERADIFPSLRFSKKELDLLRPMLNKNLNSPRTSGVGRLFDAVAALLGLVQKASFEGQGAMALEHLAGDVRGPAYSLDLQKTAKGIILDWEPMIRQILEEMRRQNSVREISQKFHASMIDAVVRMAENCNEKRIVLTGGCFQNKILCEGAIAKLQAKGLTPYWHQKIPPNDGGIALGQALIALAREEDPSCA